MSTTYAPTNVSNLALAKIGAQSITSLTDQTSPSAIQCNLNYQLAYLAVSRQTKWNCITGLAVLVQEVQIPLSAGQQGVPPSSTPWTALTSYTAGQYLSYGGAYYVVLNNYVSSISFATDLASGNLQLYNSNGSTISNAVPWAPLTFYQANAFLSYGGYYYTVNFTYTSSNNFLYDLTAGYLVQTDQQAGTSQPDTFAGFGTGSQYASGWAFKYALPDDFVLLETLNYNVGSNGGYGYGNNTDDYQIIGRSLYCNLNQAVIQYVQNVTDSTRFDSLFLHALTFKLASMIATPLRMDGGQMEKALLQGYQEVIREAKMKNGGEKQVRRFNPINTSRFNRARYGGINS